MENKTKYNDPLAQSANLDNVSTADEQLIRQFFTERMSEIPDDGFTQRVMNRLPSRTEQWLNRLWIASAPSPASFSLWRDADGAAFGAAFAVYGPMWLLPIGRCGRIP